MTTTKVSFRHRRAARWAAGLFVLLAAGSVVAQVRPARPAESSAKARVDEPASAASAPAKSDHAGQRERAPQLSPPREESPPQGDPSARRRAVPAPPADRD